MFLTFGHIFGNRFLFAFKLASDPIRFPETAPMWLFCFIVKKSFASTLDERLCLKQISASKTPRAMEVVLRTYAEKVTCLLHTYFTNGFTAKTDASLALYTEPLTMSPAQSAEALVLKSPKCGEAYDANILMAIFIDRLHETVCHNTWARCHYECSSRPQVFVSRRAPTINGNRKQRRGSPWNFSNKTNVFKTKGITPTRTESKRTKRFSGDATGIRCTTNDTLATQSNNRSSSAHVEYSLFCSLFLGESHREAHCPFTAYHLQQTFTAQGVIRSKNLCARLPWMLGS